MLIEFSVRNFRSFRDRQTLSMVAAPRLGKKQNTVRLNLQGDRLPALLKVAAIYGPNASGKSSLLAALEIFRKLCLRKPTAIAEKLPVAPFRFDKALIDKPSEFDVHFISGRVRYQFVLALTADRIFEETLISYPRGVAVEIYSRHYDGVKDQYTFDGLEGGHELHDTWRKLTGPKTLFISQAVANSNEELVQLKEPFSWLENGLAVIETGELSHYANASRMLARKMQGMADEVCEFLQEVDVPVTGIRFETIDNSYVDDVAPGKLQAEDLASQDKAYKTKLMHKTSLGEAEFDFNEESEGTKNLMGFWLPWSVLFDRSSFGTLAVDELDSSLHPKIVADLVEKHIARSEGVQLIFTTHDTHLMNTKLLRRDQFWLTERDMAGATQLRSIHDFKGRESEDVEKRYFEGRYRGLPVTKGISE